MPKLLCLYRAYVLDLFCPSVINPPGHQSKCIFLVHLSMDLSISLYTNIYVTILRTSSSGNLLYSMYAYSPVYICLSAIRLFL